MKPVSTNLFLTAAMLLATAPASQASAADRVTIANGVIETTAAPSSGVRSFKGIPFAQPPVGELRWKEPQPVKSWSGVRNADQFGPRCVQKATSPQADFWFRSNGMSEDCLYLNVWTPAKSDKERLPVLVYFYGGGYYGGDGSEPRYDGENTASKGIVTVTFNYRVNIFGFFVHPELAKETGRKGSGDYGLLDQRAALRWVQQNIRAFGGDPQRVTIAGESAGSTSASAQVASPLSKGLFAGAILESGAMINSTLLRSLGESEQIGMKFAASVGASSLAELRAMSAERLEEAVAKGPELFFRAVVDGYFLPKLPADIYAAGEQSKIPLLAGSNSEEASVGTVLGTSEPTPENFANAVRRLYGADASEVLKAYPASTPDEALQAATDLASDRFQGRNMWSVAELHRKTSGKAVYRYYYTHARPAYLGMPGQGQGEPAHRGAVHSAEIQYAMGNLNLDKRYVWRPVDYRVSEIIQGYFVNFIKTGDPNGFGLPEWPVYDGSNNYQRMRLGEDPRAEQEPHRDRYFLLYRLAK